MPNAVRIRTLRQGLPELTSPRHVGPAIYLSGPISGQTDEEICAWRDRFRVELGPTARILDPSLEASVTEQTFKITTDAAGMRLRHFARETVSRNREWIRQCDLVVANVLHARGPSIGTVGDIFWADAYTKPVLLIRERANNVHDHLLLNELAEWICHDISAAIESARSHIENVARLNFHPNRK